MQARVDTLLLRSLLGLTASDERSGALRDPDPRIRAAGAWAAATARDESLLPDLLQLATAGEDPGGALVASLGTLGDVRAEALLAGRLRESLTSADTPDWRRTLLAWAWVRSAGKAPSARALDAIRAHDMRGPARHLLEEVAGGLDPAAVVPVLSFVPVQRTGYFVPPGQPMFRGIRGTWSKAGDPGRYPAEHRTMVDPDTVLQLQILAGDRAQVGRAPGFQRVDLDPTTRTDPQEIVIVSHPLNEIPGVLLPGDAEGVILVTLGGEARNPP